MARIALLLLFTLLSSAVLLSSSLPLHDEELDRGELQTQEVSYVLPVSGGGGGIRPPNRPVSANLHVSPGSRPPAEIPLQRATTYTSHLLVPMEFQEKAWKRPKKKNLKVSRLLRKMGQDFDSQWMSVDAPEAADLVSRVEVDDNQISQLIQQVTSLNLEQELNEIAGDDEDDVNEGEEEDNEASNDIFDFDGLYDQAVEEEEKEKRLVVKEKMIAVFQQWLIKKSSCPVKYDWEDLGDYFWPRWIKKGSCSNSPSNDRNLTSMSTATSSTTEEGCSWPQGMKCVPGQAQTLHILRWHCRRRTPPASVIGGGHGHRRSKSRRQQNKHRCRWYKVPYPVTSSCRCACHQ